jgi:ABC transport system ATP-binding/permease protein
MWRLSIVDDESNNTVVNLVRKQYTIGRAEENAVRLTERNISRQHAVLERVGDAWVARDLDSYNGSFVNDEHLEADRVLKHGDRLRFGDYEAVLSDGESERAEQENGSRDAATVRELPPSSDVLVREDRLIILEGFNVGAQYPLRSSPTLIGRGEECDIALNDTSVSRQHCVLERDEHGRFQVLDKNSSNGVRVNGMEVRRITLYAGDIIELGDVQLQYLPRGTRFDPSVAGVRKSTGPTDGRFARIIPVLFGLAVVGGVVGVGLFRHTDSKPITSRSAEVSEAAMLILHEASALYARQDLEGAHRALERVAEGSTLRNSREYRRIEGAWADEQFELAERSGDPDVQRSLLNRIAQTTTVDSLRRKQAADQLARLDQATHQPDDLAPVTDAEIVTGSIGGEAPPPPANPTPVSVASLPAARPLPKLSSTAVLAQARRASLASSGSPVLPRAALPILSGPLAAQATQAPPVGNPPVGASPPAASPPAAEPQP